MTHDLAERHHVVLSGCSGGGKSTLLAELASRGFSTVPEPGRRIVEEELRSDGKALPWVDLAAFARRAIHVASLDRKRMASAPGWVFFDRGLVDAAVALQRAVREPVSSVLDQGERYHHRVFLTPPWPEIFMNDSERQHGLRAASRSTIGYSPPIASLVTRRSYCRRSALLSEQSSSCAISADDLEDIAHLLA